MRLWHQDLLEILPEKQLMSQHRECCALRGKGWGKKHSTVDYVFTHPIEKLVGYHLKVLTLMQRYNVDKQWYSPQYRGRELGVDNNISSVSALKQSLQPLIYPEHDTTYMVECLDNLIGKLKNKLDRYIVEYGTLEAKTYQVSIELDKIINRRQKLWLR